MGARGAACGRTLGHTAKQRRGVASQPASGQPPICGLETKERARVERLSAEDRVGDLSYRPPPTLAVCHPNRSALDGGDSSPYCYGDAHLFKRGEIPDVIANEECVRRFDPGFPEQLAKRQAFVVNPLQYSRDAEVGCATGNDLASRVRDERDLEAGEQQHVETQSVAHIKFEAREPIRGVDLAAVGEHTIDVQRYQPQLIESQ
jgi:hypothetical protein